MKIRPFIYYLLFAMLMTGCASHVTKHVEIPVAQRQQAWQNNYARLTQIQAWSLNGKLGIRSTEQAISANLIWRQTDRQHFQIEVYGSLGQGRTQLIGTAQHATLITADGQTLEAADPEALLQAATEWQLPVNNLFYWVRGLPANLAISQQSLNAYGYLESLEQGGWKIQFSQYQEYGRVLMPGKLNISSNGLTVTLIIKNWQ